MPTSFQQARLKFMTIHIMHQFSLDVACLFEYSGFIQVFFNSVHECNPQRKHISQLIRPTTFEALATCFLGSLYLKNPAMISS